MSQFSLSESDFEVGDESTIGPDDTQKITLKLKQRYGGSISDLDKTI